MTNSSPQPPQNPQDPNRRRRPEGITFDEMIAIIVAFSTIGAILFWSLGNRRGGFNIAGLQNLLSSDTIAETDTERGIIRITDDTDVIARVDLDRDSLELDSGAIDVESQALSLPQQEAISVFAQPQTQSFELDSQTKLTPIPSSVVTLPEVDDTVSAPTKPPAAEPGTVSTPVTEPEAEVETTPPIAEPEIAEAPETEPEIETTPEAAIAFTDVSESYWAYPFISKLDENQLTSGFSEDEVFEPEKLITRASMATLISQAFDRPVIQSTKSFTDVTEQNAIASDIDKAVRTGFMKGYSDNEFRPLENIPRYQVLVTLATGLDLKPSQDPDAILSKFSDADLIPDWAKQQVAAAVEAGLAVSRPEFADEVLNPNESATRAEVAAMIYQALVESEQLQPVESQYIIRP